MSLQILTRKNASCNELLCAVYSLNPVDLDVFYHVAGGNSATLDELAKAVRRDRTTVHRSLQKLVSNQLCYKEAKSLKGGGYYHLYSATELAKIKEQAEQRVKAITTSFDIMLRNFESDVLKHCCT